jgi:flagellar motor protein MotB
MSEATEAERTSHAPHRESHEEAHEGAPEWLISFADNVTLLMGFFVIMLAFSMAPKGTSNAGGGEEGAGQAAQADFLDMAISIRDAFNNPVSIDSADPQDALLVQRLLARLRGPVRDEGPEGRDQSVQSLRPSKYFALCGTVPFDENSTQLGEEGQNAVLDVVKHIRGFRMVLNILGHTSSAEAYASADRGMRLAFERAMTVREALVENGVERQQIRLIACGDTDRVKPVTYDTQGHRRNQRVEVVVTDQLMPDYSTGSNLNGPTKGEKADGP